MMSVVLSVVLSVSDSVILSVITLIVRTSEMAEARDFKFCTHIDYRRLVPNYKYVRVGHIGSGQSQVTYF